MAAHWPFGRTRRGSVQGVGRCQHVTTAQTPNDRRIHSVSAPARDPDDTSSSHEPACAQCELHVFMLFEWYVQNLPYGYSREQEEDLAGAAKEQVSCVAGKS